jgi:hypothetical protein
MMNDARIPRRVDEPATVVGLMIVVSVRCRQCDAPDLIGLLNAQKAACDTCGAVISLDAVEWDTRAATPRVALSATPSRARAILS